ncbi:sam dependent [Colletotrichum incanum]|uniref:Sam dependent n=1 Tax=Colletotrichum incanum TaxID=1573173 RepID=A0A166M2V5_COLIC|nr:sam dependent [Colletotrichum incanum]
MATSPHEAAPAATSVSERLESRSAAGTTAASSPPSDTEPEPGAIEADPVIGNDELSEAETGSVRTASTASLSESITEYRRVLGRTSTQKTDYWGPNDEKQNEGLELAKFSILELVLVYGPSFEHLKPGGYVEVKETDIEDHSQSLGDDLPEDHIYRRWVKIMFEAIAMFGKTLRQTRDHGITSGLRNAGFIDIGEKSWPIPVGNWPADSKLKEFGVVNLEYIDQSLGGFGVLLLKHAMGWEVVLGDSCSYITVVALQPGLLTTVAMYRSTKSISAV